MCYIDYYYIISLSLSLCVSVWPVDYRQRCSDCYSVRIPERITMPVFDCGVTLYCSSSTSVLLIYCLSVRFGALFSHLFHAPCLSRCMGAAMSRYKGRAAIPLFKAILYYGSGNSRG